MKEKGRDIFYPIINAVIISGVIIWFIGLYYLMIKAGIPYQDPPLDLWIQYEINAGIGDILMGIGFKITVSGCILRLVLYLIRKNGRRNNRCL